MLLFSFSYSKELYLSLYMNLIPNENSSETKLRISIGSQSRKTNRYLEKFRLPDLVELSLSIIFIEKLFKFNKKMTVLERINIEKMLTMWVSLFTPRHTSTPTPSRKTKTIKFLLNTLLMSSRKKPRRPCHGDEY
jgi:hypothetical protein